MVQFKDIKQDFQIWKFFTEEDKISLYRSESTSLSRKNSCNYLRFIGISQESLCRYTDKLKYKITFKVGPKTYEELVPDHNLIIHVYENKLQLLEYLDDIIKILENTKESTKLNNKKHGQIVDFSESTINIINKHKREIAKLLQDDDITKIDNQYVEFFKNNLLVRIN